MFRTLRRKKQALSEEETRQLLERATSGVLSLYGDEGYPYGVPMSYVYVDGKIYFHSAKSGHKIDAMKTHTKACFTVIEQDTVVPEEYTTYYRSAIVFGKMRILEEEEEIMEAIHLLSDKYRPGYEEERKKAIEKDYDGLTMMEMNIEHLCGKEAIELVRKKGKEANSN